MMNMETSSTIMAESRSPRLTQLKTETYPSCLTTMVVDLISLIALVKLIRIATVISFHRLTKMANLSITLAEGSILKVT